jgi:CheY-like chemotaxis protein
VIHVDDSADDLFLFQKACAQAAVSFQLELLENGKQALKYLEGAGYYLDRTRFPIPHFILLDLKMPLPDGFSILRWIRDRHELNGITLCIFTSSFQYEDIQKAYEQGANCFLTKPPAFDGLVRIATAIDQFLVSSDCKKLEELPEFRR